MGAGASLSASLPDRMDKDSARSFVVAQFDEWFANAKQEDGTITKEQVMAWISSKEDNGNVSKVAKEKASSERQEKIEGELLPLREEAFGLKVKEII